MRANDSMAGTAGAADHRFAALLAAGFLLLAGLAGPAAEHDVPRDFLVGAAGAQAIGARQINNMSCQGV